MKCVCSNVIVREIFRVLFTILINIYQVAIVKTGVPMDIALNKESKRKTPVAVYMKNGERLFGADAVTAGNKLPHYRLTPDYLFKYIHI